MIRTLTLFSLAFTLGNRVALAQSAEERGLEIARAEASAWDGYGSESGKMEMILIDARRGNSSRQILFSGQERADDGDRTRIEFVSPPDVNGTRMLTWSHKTSDDDQWLYLPAMGVVKRITAGNKSGSFMGSEFSYEDLASSEIEKYTYKFVQDTVLDGRKCWQYERTPVDPKSGYSRQVVWTDQEYLQPVRIEYFDRKGELLKTASMKNFAKLDRWWRFGEIHVVNSQTSKESRLVVADRKLNVSFAPTFFDASALEE